MMKKILVHILLLVVCLSTSSVSASVVISQVMYDSPLNERVTVPPYSNGEFIELYNMGEQPADISGWYLKGGGVRETFVFPSGTILSPGGYLVVAYRHSRTPQFVLSDLYGNACSSMILYQNSIVLSNSGESVYLLDRLGIAMDSLYYDGTSSKRKPFRLEAENMDSVPGILCRSIQRKQVAFNGRGQAVFVAQHWDSQYVVFGSICPEVTQYISESFYWTASDGLPSGENYVVSVTPLDSCKSIDISAGSVRGQAGSRMSVSVNYFDMLGRGSLSVHNAYSPSMQDVILYTDYDDDNRVIRQWRPLAKQGFMPQSAASMESAISEQYKDSAPYALVEKEKCTHGRVVRETSSGSSYQSHPSTYSYGVNADDVWKISCVDNGFSVDATYATGSLRTVTHSDADGKTTISIMDAANRQLVLILGGNNKTYYVYDNMDRLRYILPPAIVSRLSSQQRVSDNDDYMQQYAYIYQYDSAGNVIAKKIPGCEYQYMRYNQAGYLVALQDGNQRAKGDYWLHLQYDDYGRVIFLCEVDEENNTVKPLSRSAFDSYEMLSNWQPEMTSWLQYESREGFSACISNPLGLQTLSVVYHLADSGYTATSSFYDQVGRAIQLRSISSDGHKSVRHVRYNFDGTKQKELVVSNIYGREIYEETTYSYDHAGRLLQQWCSFNGDSPILLVENTYNEYGLLVEKYRHNREDSIRYDYDIRQSLTSITSVAFTEQMFYADSLPALLRPCYNGTIASVMVSHGDSAYQFGYTYDEQNRLSRSSRVVEDALVNSESFEYDEMGNILSLHRFELNGTPLDDLQYDYVGNQVLSITDSKRSQDRYDTKEYYDNADEPQTERAYDANGNLIKDADRNIVRIVYNLLNLPDSVIFADGSLIVNDYDATGTKLASRYLVSIKKELMPQFSFGMIFDDTIVDTKRSVYYGNLEFHYIQSYPDSMVLTDFMLRHSEGYLQWSLDSVGGETLSHHYLYHDHLGNVRAVWNATADTIVQRTCYYASGLPMAMSVGLGEQPYLYNGKEFVQMHGYDVFDYGFRGYYAATGQFTSIDPLCERTPWQSPYVYANNNPICNIDWMGLSGYTTTKAEDIRDFFAYLSNGGTLDDYDFDGWDMYSEDSNWWIDVTNANLSILERSMNGVLSLLSDGSILLPDICCVVTRVSLESVNKKTEKIFQGIGFAEETFSIGSSIKSGFFECNDFYWIAKNGKWHLQRNINNNYLLKRSLSLKQAKFSSVSKFLNKANVVMDVVGIMNECASIGYTHTITLSNVINIGLGIAGVGTILFATASASSIVTIVAVGYATADILTQFATGVSLSERIDQGFGVLKF